MTTASKITLVRIAMIPFFIVCALCDFEFHSYVALVIFIVAAATDGIDGYVARHYNQVSDFGKFLDPLADKLLVFAALLIFVERGQMASWVCFIVLTRELAVTGLRLVAVEKGIVIAAGWSGKIKTVVSIIGCCLMILPINSFEIAGIFSVNDICVFLIAVTTLYSGIEYFVQNKEALNFKGSE